MARILIKSRREQRATELLLNKKIPSYRQAYSDRTAWIMACVSELAYLRFNPLVGGVKQQKRLLEEIVTLVGIHSKQSLEELIRLVNYDHEKEQAQLEAELAALRLELVRSYDCNGTQAILARACSH
jgi:triacylglycerol lipase